MADTAQLNLAEPARTDWDNYNTGSKFQAPPPALGSDGKPIVYQGIVESLSEDYGEYAPKDENGNNLLNYNIDSIKLINAGEFDGYTVRFTSASVQPFKGKDGQPQKGNPSKLGNALRSAGMTAKPQSNSEWRAAASQLKGKRVSFTLDWVAKNKDTQEKVQGYLSFPEDPARPGNRKAILKAGDQVTERAKDGSVIDVKTVESEVLFANARLRYFVDPTPKAGR